MPWIQPNRRISRSCARGSRLSVRGRSCNWHISTISVCYECFECFECSECSEGLVNKSMRKRLRDRNLGRVTLSVVCLSCYVCLLWSSAGCQLSPPDMIVANRKLPFKAAHLPALGRLIEIHCLHWQGRESRHFDLLLHVLVLINVSLKAHNERQTIAIKSSSSLNLQQNKSGIGFVSALLFLWPFS